MTKKTEHESELDFLLSDDNTYYYDYYSLRKQIANMIAETIIDDGALPDGVDKTCARLLRQYQLRKLEDI